MSKKISFLKFIFHTSIIFLIVISLFPGSLFGLLVYQDLGRQADFIRNPFGTSINHFIYYFYVSILGLFLYLKHNNFNKLVFILFFLSIILEALHLLVPNRTFQLTDLGANFLGVLVAYFLVKVYLHFKKL
tara:strand:+ start:1910 stop:2302 length:393 start_codon:yes stop_codon:yes gene_type:complete